MSASKTPWLGLSLISLVLGIAGGNLSAYWQLQVPLQHLNQLTPLVIIDRAKFIQQLSPNATPEQMTRAVDDWKQLAKQLSVAGYVVIDASAVVAAPEDVYVKVERR